MAISQEFGGNTELGCAGDFENECVQTILSLDSLHLQQTFQQILVYRFYFKNNLVFNIIISA